MPNLVGYMVATDSFSGTLKNGEPIMVSKGELAHPDHPVVKQWPHLFESAAGHIRLDKPEKATKAPRKRTPRKKPEAKKAPQVSTEKTGETRGLRSEDLHRGAAG